MRAKVIIENGETTIVLTPENVFEIDVIEKVHSKKEQHNIHTEFDLEYSYGARSKHKIQLSIREERP